MKFDIFHSIGRIDSVSPKLSDREVVESFFAQAIAAEEFGYGTVWAAESHFSSEVQKRHKAPVITTFEGEVGLNNDSPQLAQALFARTRRIGFGTAIFNIVGGNGGPIGAADRVRSLTFLNSLQESPRPLNIGFASGRFPYINRPYGIVPRDGLEAAIWPEYLRFIFLEAVEIFLRLTFSEAISSEDVTRRRFTREVFKSDEAWEKAVAAAREHQVPFEDGIPYRPRWNFEVLKLVPELEPQRLSSFARFVLGSADPLALDVASRCADVDIFNLSFTPPDKINATHAEMARRAAAAGRTWHRGRMPRTVLVFIDEDRARAEDLASRAMDTYLAATGGTLSVPEKERLLARALVGDAAAIREQLSPSDPHGFHADDRLMLWFEYNQADTEQIVRQMRYFAEQVMPHFA